MALAVTVVSFSLAGNDDKEGYLSDDATLVAATVDTNTNIDNIIENSHNVRENGDHIYKIVEITSGSPSSLKTMVESGDFESFVINGNATKDTFTMKDAEGKDKIIDAVMKADSITYQSISAAEVIAAADKEDKTDYNNFLAAVSKADFIYLYNDTAKPYGKGNDLDEELYNVLHTYAVGDYKPLVISDISNSSGGGGNDDPSTTTKTTTDVANDMYEIYGRYYYTFSWKDGQSLDKFFAHKDGSMYLTMNGTKKSANWSEVATNVASPTDSTEQGAVVEQPKKMAEMLVITNGDTTPMADLVMADFGTAVTGLKYTTGTAVEGNVYDIKGNNALVYQSGYNTKYVRPDYMKVTEINLTDVEKYSLDQYDMIIIEASCAGVTISVDVYNQLSAAMFGNVHIIYSPKMATVTSSGTGSTGGSVNVGDQQETNYSEIFYMVATTTGQERYENIMVTNKTEFDIITGSKSAATSKIIADLINASAFRGIGGPKSSSSKFTVLEIQPCYPIDEELAAKNNNYYTIPSDVVNGQTKEELLDGTEYYAWELSKAKIAAAFNLTTDQITLVQMSTEQLASTKEDVFGTYDLVYIGGNRTALKDVLDYMNYGGMANAAGTKLSGIIKSPDLVTKLPIYTMYTHSGEIQPVEIKGMLAEAGGDALVGDVPSALVNLDGTRVASFGMLNGNDITYNKLEQLKEYVDQGMPVVFSAEATAGYKAARDNGANQNSIDPDCNMYKFMSYCGSKERSNVLWDFDENQVQSVDNNGGDYGDTLTGFVTVFADAQTKQLNDLYTNNVKRPKITLTEMPATYNMYDKSTVITNKTMNFKYKVSGASNYTVTLYVDDNGNSVFESGENVATGGKDELTFKTADSFYGPVYWKLVVENPNGLEASTTGICYVGNTGTSKQKVSILQIMPGTAGTPGAKADVVGEGAQGKNSLYFCVECQQAYQRLEFNPNPNADMYGYTSQYDGQYCDRPNGIDSLGNGRYLGLHEHRFGIAKYDSAKEVPDHPEGALVGADDWNLNLADEVSDKYDFDIDIMLRSEFVEMCDAVDEAYDFSDLTDEEKASLTANNPFDEKKQPDEYAAYKDAESVDDKLKMIYAINYEKQKNEALTEYNEYNSLITKTPAEFDAAFAEYDYKDELKLEVGNLSAADAKHTIAMSAIDAEIDLRNALRTMRDELRAGRFGLDPAMADDIDLILKNRRYWDYYAIANRKFTYDSVIGVGGSAQGVYITEDNINMNEVYAKYVELNDLKILANEEYKNLCCIASTGNWMEECYDMVIIGASDDFANDDFIQTVDGKEVKDANGKNMPALNALADLKDYLANDGSILMFHDTVTRFDDAGSVYLTNMIKTYAAMDRYQMEIDESKTDNLAASYYLPYKTTGEGGSDVYFMTDISPAGSTSTGADKYKNYVDETNALFGWGNPAGSPWGTTRYLTDVAYTDMSWVISNTGNTHQGGMPYKFGVTQWAHAAIYARDDKTYVQKKLSADKPYGADKASRTNQGIVTLYPFTLSDQLNVSFTHGQAYALDIENDDVTVWYSMGGGTGAKTGSSIYAASPNDGMDSYFIYTYKNFNYCGAGHTNVTGCLKDNNDERRLYINIICNSVKKSIAQPDIYVYDYKTTDNEIIKKSGDMYVTKVDTDNEYLDFSFLARLDEDAEIKQVQIYFDLDYNDDNKNEYDANDLENHILIADWTNQNVTKNIVRDVFRYDGDLLIDYRVDASGKLVVDTNGNPIPETEQYDIDGDGDLDTMNRTKLKLKPEYFDKYGGKYTYIVIAVYDTESSTPTYKRIKIELKEKLFNLT